MPVKEWLLWLDARRKGLPVRRLPTPRNGASWPKVDALKNRPALVVTSDDGLAPGNDAFAAALRFAGDSRVATLHLPTDHSYSDKRTELSNAVLHWLATLLPDQPTR